MPLVKPMVTGYGMNLIAAPSRASPKPMRMPPAMSVARASPSTPVLLHDRVHDHNERARRAADLHARPAERRDQKSAHDRREQTPLGADPTRNREGDGEGQRYDADDDTGSHIADELVAAVSPQRGDELGNQRVHIPPS